MATYNSPQCYSCQNFLALPQGIGGKAKCKAYKGGCPERVFFNGGKCAKYSPKTKKAKK